MAWTKLDLGRKGMGCEISATRHPSSTDDGFFASVETTTSWSGFVNQFAMIDTGHVNTHH